MKQELLMRKVGNALVPGSEYDQELFEEIKTNQQILVTVHQARNPEHHRKLWALASAVSRFDRDFSNAKAAVRWVKRQIPSMHRRYREKDGSVVIEYESINWANMDQIKFNEFYDMALSKWSEKIGCDPETLLDAQV